VKVPVRFEDEADLEYREAGRWYEDRRTGLGVEFFDAVDAAIRRILDFPHIGTRVPRVSRELPIRRLALMRFPYHVIYMEPAVELRILAIAHDRRKPGYWKKLRLSPRVSSAQVQQPPEA
jgi:plasmid stabilization system protein ParE